MHTIGLIGVGAMGRPMAMNLRKHGFPLVVYSRRPEAATPLQAVGADLAASPSEVAARSDVVVTMVTATPDVEEVIFGTHGVARGARPGSVIVDMSTISPDATRQMAARLAAGGLDMLDAPVSGGPTAAQAGTLLVMVGGRADVFDRMKPMLDVLGSTVVHVGPNGAGQAAKACNQLLVVMTAVAVAQALTLAKRLGLEPAVVQRTLMAGLASSRVLEVFGSRMASRDFRPGIPARLYDKDMKTIMDLFHRLEMPAPTAVLAKQYVDTLVADGRGDADFAALITLFEGAGQM